MDALAKNYFEHYLSSLPLYLSQGVKDIIVFNLYTLAVLHILQNQGQRMAFTCHNHSGMQKPLCGVLNTKPEFRVYTFTAQP